MDVWLVYLRAGLADKEFAGVFSSEQKATAYVKRVFQIAGLTLDRRDILPGAIAYFASGNTDDTADATAWLHRVDSRAVE